MTRLQKWLKANGKTPFGLAKELGLPHESLYPLATPDAQSRPVRMVRYSLLQIVAAHTGISPGQLIDDAIGWEEPDGYNRELSAAIAANYQSALPEC